MDKWITGWWFGTHRCAAWSAVLVPPYCADWTPGGVGVVGASYLPGLCQTAFRAELYAVAYTLHQAAEQDVSIRIWTDCLGVSARYYLLVWGHKRLNVNKSNADLWSWILQSVDRIGRQRIAICKVPAHRKVASATTLYEAWLFFHNDYADRAARFANQSRPQRFWDLWERHVQAVFAADRIFQQVQALHLAVGRRQVQGSVNCETGEPAAEPVRQTRVFVPRFDLGNWDGRLMPKATRLFGSTIIQRISTWFMARLAVGNAEVGWVTFAQLYLDFQLTYGHPGPLRVRQRWVDIEQRPYITAETYSFKQKVKWFRQCLKHLWKEAGVTVAMDQCRPANSAIQAFMPAASLPWDSYALAEVERWLSRHLADPCVRDAGALSSLPMASPCGSMRVAPH